MNEKPLDAILLYWYRFDQNNSGGSFQGPALTVWIQASNLEEACDIALEHDVYFNGCHSGIDCRCCGDRWYKPWESDDPNNYINDDYYNKSSGSIPANLMVYYDGRTAFELPNKE